MRDVLGRLSGARRDEILMFSVMLTVAIGNTGLQSVLPAIGRTLKLPDTLVALAFSLSAVLWATCAPFWARRMRPRHARRFVLIGLSGFVGALAVCGLALTAGVCGWLSAAASFGLFIVGRGIYGAIGSASPPAAQTIVVASTARDQRTAALSMLASAFGLGTIIGPALTPFFILPVVGATDLHMLAIAFAIASLGFGFLRPGYTAGASLAVSEGEQAVVAGQLTSINGVVLLFGPFVGIGLYQFHQAAPYLLSAAVLAAMAPYAARALGRAA